MAHGNKKKAKDGTDRGRPPGSQTKDYAVVESVLPRCKKCDSTNLGPGSNPTVFRYNGMENGKPYTHVYWTPRKCLDCGQWLKVREVRNSPEPSEESGQDQPPDEIAGDGDDDAFDLDGILSDEESGV